MAYDADLAATRAVVEDTAAAVCADERFAGDVQAAPELLGVESVTAEGVVLRLLVRTSPGTQYRLQRALREAVKLALDGAGVDVLPPPVREQPGADESV